MMVGAFGCMVQSGWRGVIFRLGRVHRIAEPGFNMMLPFFDKVKKVFCKNITLDIMRQKIITHNDYVYMVDINVVYTVDNPEKSTIEIDNVAEGVATIASWASMNIFREATHQEIQERESLNEALERDIQESISKWGLNLVRAGYTSIAPSKQTIRVSQLEQISTERQRLLKRYIDKGVKSSIACALIGSNKNFVSKSSQRKRKKPLSNSSKIDIDAMVNKILAG